MERDEYIKLRKKIENDMQIFFSKNVGDLDTTIRTNILSNDMKYIKIAGYESEGEMDSSLLVTALYSLGIAFSYICYWNNGEVNIYIGCDSNCIETLQQLLRRVYGVEVSNCIKETEISPEEFDCCKVLVGDVLTAVDPERHENIVDQLSKVRLEEKYAVVVSCCPLSKSVINKNLWSWEDVLNKINQLTSRQTTVRDERESISFSDMNNSLVRYQKYVEKSIEKMQEAMNTGMFLCSVKCYGQSESVVNLVAGVISANNCEKDKPNVLRTQKLSGLGKCMNDEIIINMESKVIDNCEITEPVFSNYYTTGEVSYYVTLPKRDAVGFYNMVQPYFEVNRVNKNGLKIGGIIRSGSILGEYVVPFEDLNRHIFITGMTGSGKTNTLKNILWNLNNLGIPWLCIEPAKAEYFDIYNLGIDELTVIDAGSTENALFINPFEPVCRNVDLQTHIDSLYAALMSSFNWVSPLPYVLENCIYRCYELCGFDIEKNIWGNVFPTIELLYFVIPHVVEEMGYDGRMKTDVVSSLQSRISTLRRGTKGSILNVKHSMPMGVLLSSNCVIELERIGDNDVKSFVMSLLMINLREYRMLQEDSQLKVKHFLVVEEAHRLLKNVENKPTGDDGAKANAVAFFTDMISELRSKGQGFIVADQIPEQLAPAILKNTNLKIVHRIVSKSDANLVGESMHANEDQVSYMCNLKRGVAEVYSEGDSSPKIVKIPFVGELRRFEEYDRMQILQKCRSKIAEMKESSYKMDFPCLVCGNECAKKFEMLQRYEKKMENIFVAQSIEDLLQRFDELVIALKRNGDYSWGICVIKEITERQGSFIDRGVVFKLIDEMNKA